MQAHIQLLHTPATPGMESKVKTFFFLLKIVMLHINERKWSIEHDASTYSVLTHILNLWVGLKGEKNLNVVPLHIN